MPKTLNSPSLNTAKDEVTIIQEITTEIKELIVKDVNAGINKQATTRKIAKLIAKLNKSINNPILLKEAKQSLALSTQRWYYEYSINTKAIRMATTRNVNYRLARNISDDLLAKGETYTVNLQSTLDTLNGVRTNNQFKKAYEEFRPYIDDAVKGTPIIRDYNKLVRGQLKVLSANPPISNRVDRNGQPYKVNLRNRAEMFVRYETNMKDLEKFAKDEDVDLVWISSHADASPRCAPFQGKLYSISGKSGTKDGVKYEALENALQGLKGDGNGCISGYNCRHRLIEYQQGSRPPADYSSAEIQKEYKIDQTQRRYENRIRQLKTEERLYRANGDTETAKRLRLKWRQMNVEYERYSLQNDRAFYRWRTRIGTEEKESNLNTMNEADKQEITEREYIQTQNILQKQR